MSKKQDGIISEDRTYEKLLKEVGTQLGISKYGVEYVSIMYFYLPDCF